MQFYAILLFTANLAVSALAAPIANATNVASPSCTLAAPIANATNGASPSYTLAAPIANATNGASPSCLPSRPDFLCGTNVGQGTYYGTGLGACGITSNDKQLIAAVSWSLFDYYPGYIAGNPNKNPVCGRKIRANYNGSSVEVKVVDRCPDCAETSLDLSPAAFSLLASQSVGRIHNMTWTWIS
ncbi:allergen Asp f 7 [Russula decolorans]